MGKAGDAEQAVHSTAPAAGHGSAVRRYAATIGGAVDAKCVLVLFLSIGVFVLVLFMLLPLHDHASETIPDDDPGVLPGEIQASFFLLKKRQQLIPHVRRLQKDIYREIGIPNTTVSVSMHTSKYKDSTYVKFGILPNPRNSSISAQSIIALRKNLIQLTLEQSNLSLTSSVFGDPHCLEILGFPGGITVPPPPDGNICPTALFNVTLNMTIQQLRVHLKELETPAPAPSLSPSNPEHPQPTTTKPYGSFSCPALERRKTVSVHRRLSTISPMMVPPEIPTRFDSWSVHTDRKNRSPLAKPMSLVPASPSK
uniref:DUF7036 domain-containing protein n=1 Tax=Oryza rufipogon TaxID=4529 RepID=A0A0E0NLE5_ORYRU